VVLIPFRTVLALITTMQMLLSIEIEIGTHESNDSVIIDVGKLLQPVYYCACELDR